jgi:chemosensory pili system protein ChpA (sensor histidine kinase/response regulator)
MEMLQAGRLDHWNMLQNAEAFLATLEEEEPRVVALRSARPRARSAPESLAGDATSDEARSAETPAAAASSLTGRGDTCGAHRERCGSGVRHAVHRRGARSRRGLIERVPVWEQNPSETDVLRDIRRGFHTLKGSGRMVGAQRIGEFSWSIESLLNRVLSQTLQRSPDMVEIVRDAVRMLPRLVDELEHPGAPAADVGGLMSRADALSGRESSGMPSPPSPAERAEEGAPVADEPPVTDVDDTGFDELDADFPADAAFGERMDPVLRDIFRKEAAGHVAIVRDFISRGEPGAGPYAVTEALYRACHTLSGIAKTAGVRQGIKVAEPMEHYIGKLHECGHGLPEEGLTLLRDTARTLENVVAHIDEDTGFFPDPRRLIAGWHALERALDTELANLAEVAVRAASTVESSARGTGSDFEAEVESYLERASEPGAEQRGESLVEPVEFSEPAARAPFDEPTPVDEHAGSDEYTGIDEPAAADEFATLADAADARLIARDETLVDASADSEPEAEFDPEIAAIFSEEASELLEQSDVALGSWRRDRSDRAHMIELRRLLHTLKGGARMAGIRAMGDLSHELESLLESLEIGTVTDADAAIDVLQRSLDELHRLRDAASRSQPPPSVDELVATVRPPGFRAPRANACGDGSRRRCASRTPADSRRADSRRADSRRADSRRGRWRRSHRRSLRRLPSAQSRPSARPSRKRPLRTRRRPTAKRRRTTAPLPYPAQPPFQERTFEPLAPAAQWRTEFESTPAVTDEMGEAGSQPVLPGREPVSTVERQELARVDAELLDQLLNNAGEVSIFRARVEQQMTSIEFNLAELGRTVTRLREQLRKLELETEAQILHGHQDDVQGRSGFDPLELDRYSTIQQLSRALAESVSDVASLEGLLGNLNRDAQNLLLQQGRIVTELQNGLMRTRMVPFERHVQRLTRIVRQAAQETGKQVELITEGAAGELDRQVLERMLPPFEHMLRNSVVHGIETPAERRSAGKPDTGSHQRAVAARGRRGRDHRRGRWRGTQRQRHPREGATDGPARRRADDHGRGSVAADPRARIQHRRPAHPAGRTWRRHGCRRDRGQEARRRTLHRVDHRARRAFHDPPAVHARDHAGPDRARARGAVSHCRSQRSRASRACRGSRSCGTSTKKRRRSNMAGSRTGSSISAHSSAAGRRPCPSPMRRCR